MSTGIKRGDFLKKSAMGGAGLMSLVALERLTARQAVGDPDLPVDIELRPGTSRSGGRGLR